MSNQNAIQALNSFIANKNNSVQVPQMPLQEIAMATTALPLSDYQIDAVQMVLKNRGVLIGDEMGVGKTAQGVCIIKSAVEAGMKPVLVVVPPHLRLNWIKEFKMFAPSLKVEKITGKGTPVIGGKIVTDINPKTGRKSKRVIGGTPVPLPECDVLLMGDLSIEGYKSQLKAVCKAIVVDECHRMKSSRSKRSDAVVEIARALPAGAIRVAMSGTALINHPKDLIPTLLVIDRLNDFATNNLDGFDYFLGKFAPRIDRFGTRGVAHLDELHARLNDGIMIRRLRSEVLTLPNKGRVKHHIEIAPAIADKYMEAEADLFQYIEDMKGTPSAERAMKAEAISRINTLRDIVGHGKIAGVVDYVKNLLDEDEQVFITCTHRAVAQAYVNHFAKHKMPNGEMCRVVRIEGGMSDSAKNASVEAFQNRSADVLVGNVIASGVGITLTSGRHHVASEICWTSADLAQCEDRLARRGQEREVVSHIMLGCIEGDTTIDERLFAIVDAKCGVLNAVLDGVEFNFDGNLINDEYVSNANAVLASYGWRESK